MIAELKKRRPRHMAAASSRLRHGVLSLEVAPLEVLWAPRPRYHAFYTSLYCWLAVKTARFQTAHGGGGGGGGGNGRAGSSQVAPLHLPHLLGHGSNLTHTHTHKPGIPRCALGKGRSQDLRLGVAMLAVDADNKKNIRKFGKEVII